MRTITTRHRLGLVTVAGAEYQIADIGMRMLEPHELLRAQFGRFAETYDLSAAKTKAAQVRLIGNSVCPEVAEALVRATDGHLNELARYEQLARPPIADAVWDPVAKRMHEESGFLERCIAEGDTWDEVRGFAQFWLSQQKLDPKNTYFAGSSVHFDVAFLREHAPHLLGFASHRLLDVSVFRVLASAWGLEKPKGEPAHTPLRDLEASIADFRFWLGAFRMRFPIEVLISGVAR
jgi:oligoribonuclease (3'-5' exoribonuclease)